MFGIRFIKFDSTTYVVHYKKGKVVKEGRGLAFYYYAPSSSIVALPLGSDDVQFIFNGTTSDAQTISVQGQITYKIDSPKQLAELLDFTVDEKGKYKKDDKEKLHQRLINEAQTATASFVQSLDIKSAIRSAKELEQKINETLKVSKAIEILGLVPLSVNVLAVKPDPKTEKALEAKTREALQGEADLAIYDRRNFAVEQERKIKESELNTEIAIEEKRKQIDEKKMQSEVQRADNDRKLREMKIDADTAIEKKKMETEMLRGKHDRELREMNLTTEIELENKRKEFVEMKVENEKKEAEAKAYALDIQLKAYKQLEWKTIMAISGRNMSPAENISFAFREMAENAQRIGNLNITPDLLSNIMQQQQ